MVCILTCLSSYVLSCHTVTSSVLIAQDVFPSQYHAVTSTAHQQALSATPHPSSFGSSPMPPPRRLAPLEVTKDGKDILSLLRIGSKSKGGHLGLPTPKAPGRSPSVKTWGSDTTASGSSDGRATTPRPMPVPEHEEMVQVKVQKATSVLEFTGMLMAAPYMIKGDDVVAFYKANLQEGLTSQEADRRRGLCGKNTLKGRRSLHPVSRPRRDEEGGCCITIFACCYPPAVFFGRKVPFSPSPLLRC